MSINRDCYACMAGNHSDHNPTEGLRKGLVGGYHCACGGDCNERAAAAYQRMMATTETLKKVPSE